ncbi:Putative malate dehydrogenase 1B [Desmophyllum pertusum]|uniref:Malate dehydrogenase, cytoplasmic n=1 Tax=Desmophyllum pertusum TaxID=174260 RepID=A0A9W9ZYL5_9CNID|nr:Putative malate dehydrogenase 1B [Desmophyllum pertusum]
MAKYVIAGKANCPFYAKAEHLADELTLKLADFKVHKIVKQPEEWADWLKVTCEEKEWKHFGSPLIWRELVDRGGAGILLGGCDDFLEMAKGYYGITSVKMSDELVNIAKENLQTKVEIDGEEEQRKAAITPLRVCVGGASNALAYGVLSYLAQGEVFGIDQEVSIYLLDTAECQEVLEGTAMEIKDCSWPLLRDVVYTSDPAVAFNDASVVVLLDGVPLTDGGDKKEQLLANAKIFKAHGQALDQYAKKDAKVLIGGGPSSVNAFVTSKFAPSIPKQNVCALARLQENRAKGLLAKKLIVNTAGLKDVVIWGNIGVVTTADPRNARVHGYDGAIWGPHIPGFTRQVPEMVHDDKWLAGEFLETLKKPLDNVKNPGATPSLSGSFAVLSQLCDLWQGTSSEIYSLGVFSEGWYDLPQDIVFSLPVKFGQGSWKIVDNILLDDTLKAQVQTIAEELKKDCEEILSELSSES